MKYSLKKNYAYNLMYQLLIVILPVLTTPYLSRVLGVHNIGVYSYTLSIATYFVLFGSLGVSLYGQREIAYVRDNKEKTSKTFLEILFFRFFTMLISLIAFYLLFCLNGQYKIYYRILILELVSNSFDISWFFQGFEDFKKTVTRNFFVKIISLICIFTFVRDNNDLWLYILIYVLSNLIGNISLWFYLPKYVNKVNFKNLDLKRHIKPTIALFIPQIATTIYTVLDKTMIGGILNDMVAEGNYEQSQKIIKMALTVVTSLGTVVSPRIANTMAKNDKSKINHYLSNSFKFVWLIGVPIMFGIAGVANSLVPWFLGNEFDNSKYLLMIGAPLIIAIGLNNVTGVQYLISVKRQSLFTKSVVIGAVFNFIFNLLMIPKYGAIGAIVSSVMAEFLILFIQLNDIKKEVDIHIVYQGCLKYILFGLIMFVPIYVIGIKLSSTIITTFLQVICGTIIYIILLFISKDKFTLELLDGVLKYFRKKV